jgi:phosphate transport system ATP-binding protein
MISIQDVSASYYNEAILRNISMEVEEFSILAVIGPLNSGKSTFLKLFNRLDEVKKGFKITGKLLMDDENIFEQDIYEIRRKAGLIFSKPYLLPGTVFENLVFGLRIQKIADEAILKNKVLEVLEYYQLSEYFHGLMSEQPGKLSIFKQQLVALARVLVLNPDILLFDKPTLYFPEIASGRFESIIYSLKKRHTIILNPSNLVQARALSNHIVFIYNGNMIEYNNTNTFFTQPKMELTANYIRGRFDI